MVQKQETPLPKGKKRRKREKVEVPETGNVVAWWNGGGKLIPRIKANPELQRFMATNPDIFAYGEALVFKSTKEHNITGYKMMLHKARTDGIRRGIAVYYRDKHAHTITKDATSKEFDIIWIRMKNKKDERIFGFFYAPGAHKDECIRERFYDELRRGVDSYRGKKVYLLGDSNARLGDYSGDKDIHGKTTTNKNKTLFMGFVQYTGMVYLNKTYAWAEPTYEIPGQKKSIIDVALANSLKQVKTFTVRPQILGANAQTCHKIITLTLRTKGEEKESTMQKVKKFRHCSKESLVRVKSEVAITLKTLRLIRGNKKPSIQKYDVLRRIYHNAKVKRVGYKMNNSRDTPVPMSVKTVQAQMNQTMTHIQRETNRVGGRGGTTEKQKELIQRYQSMEKELYSVWTQERQRKWAIWVRKLNNIDHSKATRAFYKELKSSNVDHEVVGPIVNKEGLLSTNIEECLENWRRFYEQLYSSSNKKTNSEGNEWEKNLSESKLSKEQEESLDKEISIKEVVEAAFTLKHDTAAGKDSILSSDIIELLDTSIQRENWKNVEILKFLHKMLQNMWKEEKVHRSFKETVLRPFLKNADKSPTDPGNYRPVSLLNIPMKLYEHIIKERLVAVLEKNRFFSCAQAAYRKGRSTLDHILVIQEIFFSHRYKNGEGQAKDKRPLYLGLIDLAKAFDSVPRRKLFKKLWNTGVKGKMYRVIKDLYTDNQATIRIGDYETKNFKIQSGVMQGSKLGPILFNIFINDLLERLLESKLGVLMENITVTSLGFADDVMLITDVPSKQQALLDICGNWSELNGMPYNISKCKVLVLNTRMKGLSFHLQGKKLEIVTKTRYLGVTLSRSRLTSLYGRHIANVLERAEARANALRHAGFQKDGLRPETSTRMYKALVRPILEYAAGALSYKHYYYTERKSVDVEEPPVMVKRLEKLQNKVLKKLIPCPKNTPPAILRLITGTMPISARIDMLKLRYFWKLHHAQRDNVAHLVYKGLRKNFLKGAVGFVHEVFNICCKYSRIDIWHGICPPKINPLAMIKKMVVTYHLKKDVEAAQKSNCGYTALKVFKGKTYSFEPWLSEIGRFESTMHRRTFLYSLLDSSNYERTCRNCGTTATDIVKHGLTECTRVASQRKKFILLMSFYNAPEGLDITSKHDVFKAAMGKKCLLKVVCELLMTIWKFDNDCDS